jgi:predicted small lipoprotein YifL
MKKLLMFVLLALIALSGCGTKSPGDTVKDFYAAVAEKNLQKAQENSTKATGDYLAASLQGLKYNMLNLEIVKEEINGDKAKVGIKYLDNGRQKETTINLEKIDGKWKVKAL